MRHTLPALTLGLLALTGCEREVRNTVVSDPAMEQEGVSLPGSWDARMTPEQLEQGRLDASWARVVQLDTAGLGSAAAASTETFEQISPETVNTQPMQLPLYGDVKGPSVLRVQILLDRALFSPGIIDGHWGKNTEKAVYWFQQREGLRGTGRVDEETFTRLVQTAGGSPELIRTHQLSASDVEGPFVSIPEDIYEKAKLDCLCYESLTEKLAEMFHTSPALLQQLNDGVDLGSLTAGSSLRVPAVRDPNAGTGAQVARIVVSGEGFYVHALDAAGRILFHFPSTLGSSFDPSPEGDHRVTRITKDPWWHYQPSILEHVDSDDEEAKIPPGPNNAVGVVWMALSIPHYGIHGTSAPETIGYTTSAGCVRLTNWDALFLADRIQAGTPVQFQGTRGGSGTSASTASGSSGGGASPAPAPPTRPSAAAASSGNPGATTAPAPPPPSTPRTGSGTSAAPPAVGSDGTPAGSTPPGGADRSGGTVPAAPGAAGATPTGGGTTGSTGSGTPSGAGSDTGSTAVPGR